MTSPSKKRDDVLVVVSPVSHSRACSPVGRNNFDHDLMWLCLGRDLLGSGWHLQYGRLLASGQFRHQDDLTVRQFQSIMVDLALLLIDLPEPGNLVREPFVAEAIGRVALQILFKGEATC